MLTCVRIAGVALMLVTIKSMAADPIVDSPDNYPSQRFNGRKHLIDPEHGAYGVPFNASEADIVKAFGRPNGVYQMSDDRRALIYGKSNALILKGGRFVEIYVTEQLLDWDFANRIEPHPFFDDGTWEVVPGIKKDMAFDKIKAVVGANLGDAKYEATYTTDHATIKLRFASSRNSEQETPKYVLMSVSIRHH